MNRLKQRDLGAKTILVLAGMVMTLSVVSAKDRPSFQSGDDVQNSIITFVTPYEAAACEQKILDLVGEAHKKILMLAYGFNDPKLCQALIDAQSRGVQVLICMDKTEAATPKQHVLVERLKSAKIPMAIGKSEIHNQLQHSKVIIVDDSIVESGSLNYGQSGLDQDNFADIIVSESRAKKFTEFFGKVWTHIVGSEPPVN